MDLDTESRQAQSKILRALKDGRLSLGDLLRKCDGVKQSILMTYVRVLRANDIVKGEKTAEAIYYSLAPGVEVDGTGMVMKKPMRPRVTPAPATVPNCPRDPAADAAEGMAIDKAFGSIARPHRLVFPDIVSIEPETPPLTKADIDRFAERVTKPDHSEPAPGTPRPKDNSDVATPAYMREVCGVGTKRKIVVRPEVRIAEISVSVDHDGTVRVDPFPFDQLKSVVNALMTLDLADDVGAHVPETAQKPAGGVPFAAAVALRPTAPGAADEARAAETRARKKTAQAGVWARLHAHIAVTALTQLQQSPGHCMKSAHLLSKLLESGVKIMGRYPEGVMVKSLSANPAFWVDEARIVHLSAKS